MVQDDTIPQSQLLHPTWGIISTRAIWMREWKNSAFVIAPRRIAIILEIAT
jgi:hypothetical protein